MIATYVVEDVKAYSISFAQTVLAKAGHKAFDVFLSIGERDSTTIIEGIDENLPLSVDVRKYSKRPTYWLLRVVVIVAEHVANDILVAGCHGRTRQD